MDPVELAATGLPVTLHGGGLELGDGLRTVTPAERSLEDMRPVLADPGASGPAVMYVMYRGVRRAGDEGTFEGAGMRFDLTVLAPGRAGGECVKTFGHYHPEAPGGGCYPELYQVVSGRACFLLQAPAGAHGAAGDGARDGAVRDFVAVEAGPGGPVVVPPGYGHVTVNLGPGPLVIANLVYSGFDSVYEPFRKLRGAAYYVMGPGSGPDPWFSPNPAYGAVPSLRRARPAPVLGLDGATTPIYLAYVADPRAFEYLREPRLWRPGVAGRGWRDGAAL